MYWCCLVAYGTNQTTVPLAYIKIQFEKKISISKTRQLEVPARGTWNQEFVRNLSPQEGAIQFLNDEYSISVKVRRNDSVVF